MESVRKTNKKGERKIQLVISNGNGIAGLLVFGGALAIAGFIALSSFVTNRNKAKGKSALTEPEPKPQQLSSDDNIKRQDHDDHHVHETENTPNNGGDAVSASHVTSDMSINQTLILEKKTVDSPNFVDDDHQEIVLSDDSLPESGASSSNENGIEEECFASMFDNSGSQAHEDEPQESLKSIQTERKDDDNDDDNAVLEGGKEEEKEVEVEKGEEEKEEVVEEESSKATEGTALNSKEQEVIPGELTEEEAEQDFEGEKGTTESEIQSEEAQGVNKTDSSASAGTNVAVTPDATSNEKANFSVGLNHQPSPSQSFQLITWLMPLLLLLASLLLLVLFTQQSFYVPGQGI